MSIHHAIRAKAEKKGILVEDAPEGSHFTFRAFWPEKGTEFWGNNPSTLCNHLIYARMQMLEHPGLHLEQDEPTEQTITASFGDREIGEFALDDIEAAMPDILDDLSEDEREEAQETATAEEAEEDTAKGGSVVPDRYKRKYAEEGHAGNCGDWLALVLVDLTTTNSGKLDVDAMDEIARLNGVDTAKLNRTSRGWQGRFRMTARNMLVKVVAKQGHLNVPPTETGDTLVAPAEWCARNATKVREAGNKKQAKQGAAA